MTQAFKKIVSIAFVGVLSIFAHAAGASVLKTAPWQQNVYTNRFTIFCETAETVPGLSLQYGSGYGQSVEMTCVPGDSDGTTQHYIYKGRVNLDSGGGVIGSLVSYRIVADGAVLKCPDGSDAAGSVWVWKDVPNERLTVALWSDNQVGAKVGDYDLDRFAYIKAAFGWMVAHDVDFGISTGDMTTSGDYAGQTRPCILDGSGILGRTRPYYVCFGNHDDYVAPDEMNKRYFETGSLDEPAYGTSERGAYYFYRGNVLFIFLHWPHDDQQGDYSVYRTWLQDLLATPRAKQAKFRLLFSHKPMFLEVWSEGSEGRNYDTSLYDTAVAGGVDMVVSGHMHGYERTVTDKGLVQLVNGGMGSLDHKEHVVNNYGDWTKMGGHRNIPYLWARQSGWKKPTLCGYFPVNMGCITSYCEMKIDGGELNVQAHGFCANGDYIGVFDDFTLVSKTDRTPPTPRRAVTAACADPSSFDTFVNTPVTNAKWKEYKDAVDEDFTYATADASKPVVNVSKDEITRFCAWLSNGASGVSYRLPTETELRAKRTNLAGAVTEWTSTVDKETGWCRILGGNALASNTVWTASGDKPAIASSGCHANYLGFRLVKERGTETYDVTLESLLDEMCDADAATRLAALPWTGRLWSSYDRRSVSAGDSSTWYANNDRSQFVRTETRSGRTECVMVDAKGPGALTRLWTANGYGTVYRFYVDGATEPVICGVGTNLIGGHVLCPAPLADEVSQLQNPVHRAQDLYLPIPFSQSLVVTAELKDIPPDDDEEETIRLWYNAEVRTYAEGTRVEPFSSAVLARAQDAIAAANAALRSPSAPVTDEAKSLNGALAAGVSRSVTFTRAGGAIRSISLRLADGDEPLRTVRVKITFDGETTVDAAVGQLFGAGYAATPYATVNGGVAADGTLTFRQVMPFASSCTVTLENTGRSSCSVVASSVAVGPYDWDDARSLHFGALGFEERALPTRRGSAGYYDLPWVKLEGRGQLVGNTLMLDNSQSSDWWGEGDEKIYVDGETFPSYFGTGTEDFFGYAWGHGKAFTDHPFLALPLAGDSLTGGRRLVTAVRARRLDVVPFATSLKLDVEIWHWADCAMDYAPATFWYARPGVKVTPGGRGAEPEPPPVDPTAYGAVDKKASTYTWKGGSGPWEHTTNWTPSASATYGIPSSKTYATANFPASLAEATTCTLTSDRSVKNVYFDSPNLTFVIDNATLTVTGTIRDGSYGAYNFGNTATGKSMIVFKGAAPGIYETTGDWRSNFGCLKGAASGVCTVRFEIPAANWAAAPIRTAATESKVCFWGNVKLEIDATALGVPSSGADVTVPLVQSAEGVFFLDNSADLNDCMSAVIARSSVVCAAGATGEVVRADNDLRFVLRGVRDPIPREIADGRAGDAITIPPGAAVDVTDPKRLVVNGAAYDVKPHYVFAATAAGGVALAIAPEEAEIAGFSVGADGVVTVTSGKAFDGFRYALEYADALPFGVAPSKTELRALGETRELSVSSEWAPRRFYRLVVTDRDVAP